MVGVRGAIIGGLLILLGLFFVVTFTSPEFLFSLGISIKTYNMIDKQIGLWWPVIGIGVVIAGLVAMGKLED